MQKGSLNKALIIGHVGQDPEVRYTPSGTAVVNISVATNEVMRDAEGNDKELTEWHRVVLWGKQAEFAGNFVKKGKLVFIDGRLQTRSWEDRNQVKRYTTEVVANVITLLGGAGPRQDDDEGDMESEDVEAGDVETTSTESGDEEITSAEPAAPDDDDIPF
ncbi:single-stranded DNA-binding protein [Candidatus Neomarinimicrobiota bacterium]